MPPGDYTVGPLNLHGLLAVNMFVVRHLVRLYAAFDGDLIEAIVLGEVAHHNLSALPDAVPGRAAQREPIRRRSRKRATTCRPTRSPSRRPRASRARRCGGR